MQSIYYSFTERDSFGKFEILMNHTQVIMVLFCINFFSRKSGHCELFFRADTIYYFSYFYMLLRHFTWYIKCKSIMECYNTFYNSLWNQNVNNINHFSSNNSFSYINYSYIIYNYFLCITNSYYTKFVKNNNFQILYHNNLRVYFRLTLDLNYIYIFRSNDLNQLNKL